MRIAILSSERAGLPYYRPGVSSRHEKIRPCRAKRQTSPWIPWYYDGQAATDRPCPHHPIALPLGLRQASQAQTLPLFSPSFRVAVCSSDSVSAPPRSDFPSAPTSTADPILSRPPFSLCVSVLVGADGKSDR